MLISYCLRTFLFYNYIECIQGKLKNLPVPEETTLTVSCKHEPNVLGFKHVQPHLSVCLAAPGRCMHWAVCSRSHDHASYSLLVNLTHPTQVYELTRLFCCFCSCNQLKWLRDCIFLKFLLPPKSQKRLGYKENNTKYR